MTLWIGVERALTGNEYLRELEPITGSVVPARAQAPLVSRYSFVLDASASADPSVPPREFDDVLAMLSEAAGPPLVLLAWRVPGHRRLLSSYWVTKRQQEGWMGGQFGETALLGRPGDAHAPLQTGAAALRAFPEGGYIVIWTPVPTDELMATPLAPSFEYLAVHGEWVFAPNAYDWIVSNGSIVASLTTTKPRDPRSSSLVRPQRSVIRSLGDTRPHRRTSVRYMRAPRRDAHGLTRRINSTQLDRRGRATGRKAGPRPRYARGSSGALAPTGRAYFGIEE